MFTYVQCFGNNFTFLVFFQDSFSCVVALVFFLLHSVLYTKLFVQSKNRDRIWPLIRALNPHVELKKCTIYLSIWMMRAFHGDNWWEFLRSFSLYVAPMLLGSYQFYWGDGLLQFWRKLILGKTTFSFVYYRKACFKVTCTILAPPPRVLRYFRTFVILHVLWIEIDLWQLKISNYLVFSNLFFVTSYYICLLILVWYWLSIYTIVFEILEPVYEVEIHSYKTCTSGLKLPWTVATIRQIIIIYIKSSEFMGIAQLTENDFTLMKDA